MLLQQIFKKLRLYPGYLHTLSSHTHVIFFHQDRVVHYIYKLYLIYLLYIGNIQIVSFVLFDHKQHYN